MAGRPTLYSDELAELICEYLAQGIGINRIASILAQTMDNAPSGSTIVSWQQQRPDFYARCARAREVYAEAVSEEMADIERRVLAGEVPSDVARVVLSSQQWRTSKLAPRRYGNHVEQTVVGADGGPVEVAVRPAREMSAQELAAEIARIEAELGEENT